MAYDLQLVQINSNTGGMGGTNTAWGFPANTNFHTLLMSYWMCGPLAVLPLHGVPGIWLEFLTAPFFSFDPGITHGITLTNQTLGSSGHFFTGSFSLPPPPGMLLHFMLSVDTHAQIVQLYINDQAVVVTGGAWTGTPPFDFNVKNTVNIWDLDVSGVISSARYPALADVWISNPPAFIDLSITANRRKFINADLTAVDLGGTGTNPFGYQPAIYMSVRAGGVPTDLGINRGVGGGTWNFTGGTPPTFQAPGACTLPTPPPGSTKLAMDNVVATAQQTLLNTNLVSLRWSDDRAHSFGSPVSQSIGEAGEYRTSLQWQRCGFARDRVWEISWSVPCRTALQGCWVDVTPASS